MWANQICLIPIAAMLSTYTFDEEVKMEGDLIEELDRVINSKMHLPNLKLGKTDVKAKINMTYPAGSTLWIIVCSIIERYHLIPELSAENSKVVVLTLKEGSAWKR